MSQNSNFCQICSKELAKFWKGEFERAKSVDTKKQLKDNTRQNDYTNLMEEYKQILEYVVAHGLTQECLQDLSDIHHEFETARRKWAKMSIADASSPDEHNAYDEYNTNFIHQMSDPKEAEECDFIWSGRFRARLRTSKHRILRMLGEIDTTLNRLRLFKGEVAPRLIIADGNGQLYCHHLMWRRLSNLPAP